MQNTTGATSNFRRLALCTLICMILLPQIKLMLQTHDQIRTVDTGVAVLSLLVGNALSSEAIEATGISTRRDDNRLLQPRHKMVAFTDINYVPIAKKWFDRVVEIGYSRHEVVIVCNDQESFDILKRANYTVEECFIINPDRKRLKLGFMRQLMMERLKYSVRQLAQGISLLLTDVDNIFMRYVPLSDFFDEDYDVLHAHEMRFPVPEFKAQGFVVCAGHQFFKATNKSIDYIERAMLECQGSGQVGKCNDQVAFNRLLLNSMGMEWSINPHDISLPRVSATNEEMNGLLIDSFSGVSNITGLRVKVWDRDFATRWAGEPEVCPSLNNWVAMPTKMNLTMKVNKVQAKLLSFDEWDSKCGVNGTKPRSSRRDFRIA